MVASSEFMWNLSLHSCVHLRLKWGGEISSRQIVQYLLPWSVLMSGHDNRDKCSRLEAVFLWLIKPSVYLRVAAILSF